VEKNTMTDISTEAKAPGKAGAVVTLTADGFDETLKASSTVIVDFWAPWCGPCRSFAPIYEATAEKHPATLFAKVNVDEQQLLAMRYGIRAIPTLMVFHKQQPVFSQPGALPAAVLEELVTKVEAI
jgi:thioredoxin 1